MVLIYLSLFLPAELLSRITNLDLQIATMLNQCSNDKAEVMKTHTTNYQNTFIAVADDCPTTTAETPSEKAGQKTVAGLQFEMISKNPYRYTSDDVMFAVFVQRHDLVPAELEEAKFKFFSKGQACLRASALGKRYGWGIHHNETGKIALYGRETKAYNEYLSQKNIKVVKAMQSKKS